MILGAVRFRAGARRRPALIGQTSTGKTIIVIYECHKDAGNLVVRPVSAYEIEE